MIQSSLLSHINLLTLEILMWPLLCVPRYLQALSLRLLGFLAFLPALLPTTATTLEPATTDLIYSDNCSVLLFGHFASSSSNLSSTWEWSFQNANLTLSWENSKTQNSILDFCVRRKGTVFMYFYAIYLCGWKLYRQVKTNKNKH